MYHGGVTYFNYIALSILLGLLVWLSIFDVRERRLPNPLVLAVAGLGLAAVLLQCAYASSLLPLSDALVGVLLTAGPACLFSAAYYFVRRQAGFGMGDLKLLAALGLYLGIVGVWVLPLACIIAILGMTGQTLLGHQSRVTEKAQRQTIAFGPYIAIATVILLLV
ncbi:MAG: prepilin peptidase [Coriobacteriia bacterium]|nr:prepilin peptidase [Coriobacteriia bacterium]